MSTPTTKRHLVKQPIFFVILLFAFLASVVSIYSAPEWQSDSPPLDESLAYLTLDHYEMDPRAFREAGPSVSPDSPESNLIPWSRLVYQSYRTDNWDIYFSDDTGYFEMRLTTFGGDDIHPRLNRGCTKVVYASRQNGDYEIFVMNNDGTNKTQLTSNNTDDVFPYWSPDGTKIVFQAYRDGQPEIYVMNADGTNPTRLTHSSDYDGMPAWSPDGTLIAFSSRRTGGYRIYTMNTDGSSQAQRSNQSYSLEPAWSPDSAQIAYAGDSDGNTWFEVWSMNADGSTQTLRYNPGNQRDALPRSWSPDRSYIAITDIYYTNYQGNWYWTQAFLGALSPGSYGYSPLGPHDYPYRDWYPDWQTVDTQKPTSRVLPIASLSPAPFSVSWRGSDTGESGFRDYDVQMRDGVNGSWTTWKNATTQLSEQFTGVGGHTYYFRSRGRDNSFNLEAWPATHDAATTVEMLPPQVSMTALPAYSRNQGFFISWNGYDPGGSGIASYDVQYRAGTNGNWINLLTNTTNTVAPFSGTPGTTYYFRVRGRDKAQNVSAWPGGTGHTSTTFYTWAISGIATNNAGTPIMGLTTTTAPNAFTYLPDNANGQYGAYVATHASLYMVDWNKTGYGDLPITQFSGTSDVTHNITLPPADNLIQNEHFEIAGLANWQISGTLPVTQTHSFSHYHSGATAALIGSSTALNIPPAPDQPMASQAGWATLEQSVTIPMTQTTPTLSFWYWLNGMTGAGGGAFTVQATQGSTTTIMMTAQTDTTGWQHGSFDLSAYAGQSITLTFRLDTASGTPTAKAYLDEVTLGSTEPDVWVSGDYMNALPGETVTYAVTYGNQGATAANGVILNHTLATGLTFVSATVAPTQINGATLTWDLSNMSSHTGPATIYVTVQISAAATPFATLSSPLDINTTSSELETGNNHSPVQIYLAQLTFLPIIIR